MGLVSFGSAAVSASAALKLQVYATVLGFLNVGSKDQTHVTLMAMTACY